MVSRRIRRRSEKKKKMKNSSGISKKLRQRNSDKCLRV